MDLAIVPEPRTASLRMHRSQTGQWSHSIRFCMLPRLTDITDHPLDVVGDDHCAELGIDAAVGLGGDRLVDAADTDAVPRLACVHQVILSVHLSAPGQLPGRRRLGQLLHMSSAKIMKTPS